MKTEILRDRRLRILQAAMKMTDHLGNESLLRACLIESGHAVTQEELRAAMEWLEEHELICVQRWTPMLALQLTPLGVAVANGRASQPGVAPPITVDRLMSEAFGIPRDPRSPEYKAGARAALEFRINQVSIPMPYPPGSTASDAYYAGIAEGHAIWAHNNWSGR
ncbi:MAG: hypothetical protein WC091_01300 [Sulfuricellaceae bacterium]